MSGAPFFGIVPAGRAGYNAAVTLTGEARGVQCPECSIPMFVLEFEMVELDYCPQCRGVWLDSGELELIGERAGALRGEFLSALERGEGKKGKGRRRRCPVCARKMGRLETGGPADVTLDVCGRRHGIWFEHGELRAVVAAAGASADNVLARFFADLDRPPEEVEQNPANQEPAEALPEDPEH